MEIGPTGTKGVRRKGSPDLQVSAGARKYANHTYLMKPIEAAVETRPGLDIVVHLTTAPTLRPART